MNREKRALGDVVGLVCIIAMTACGSPGVTDDETASAASPSTAGETVIAQPYDTMLTPAEMLTPGLNANVFAGTISQVLPAVRTSERTSPGTAFEMVHTPVVVRVTEVFVGDLAPDGEVTIRALGGSAGGLTFDYDGPDETVLREGAALVVFAGERTTIDGESGPALTPNLVLLDTGGELVDQTRGSDLTREVVAKDEFLEELRTLREARLDSAQG